MNTINGRDERVNQNLRNALRKTYGAITRKLQQVACNYNNACQRGIGTTTTLALSNRQSILLNVEKYAKEVSKKDREVHAYNTGDSVVLRYVLNKSQICSGLKEVAVALRKLFRNYYEVKLHISKAKVWHATRLKKLKQEMFATAYLFGRKSIREYAIQ